MRRLPHALLPIPLLLLMAACTPAPPPPATDAPVTAPAASTDSSPPAATQTPPPAVVADDCDASKAQWSLGQNIDEALLERARVDAGAATVRSLKPGQVVTMEFNATRLNLDVDDHGTVTGARCG